MVRRRSSGFVYMMYGFKFRDLGFRVVGAQGVRGTCGLVGAGSCLWLGVFVLFGLPGCRWELVSGKLSRVHCGAGWQPRPPFVVAYPAPQTL